MKQIIRLSGMTYYNNQKYDDLVILEIEKFNPKVDIEYSPEIMKSINTILIHYKQYGVFFQKKDNIWLDDFEYKYNVNWDNHGYVEGDDLNNIIKFKQQNQNLMIGLCNPPDVFIVEHLNSYFWKKRQQKLGKL